MMMMMLFAAINITNISRRFKIKKKFWCDLKFQCRTELNFLYKYSIARCLFKMKVDQLFLRRSLLYIPICVDIRYILNRNSSYTYMQHFEKSTTVCGSPRGKSFWRKSSTVTKRPWPFTLHFNCTDVHVYNIAMRQRDRYR